MVDDIDREFEDAAAEFAAAERAFLAHYKMNVSTDPVDNQRQISAFQRAKGRLLEAQSRMERARRAKYPNSLY